MNRLAPTPIARGASWFVALAALMLIGLSVGSYFYHRRQLESIAARHLRVVIAGSGELQAGMPSAYNLLVTTVTGEPGAAPVEWSLSTPDGKRLVDRKETTDDQGRLTMVVPGDMDLPTRSREPAQLSVSVGGGANPPSVALPLPIQPARYLTRLWLDRRSYRPGETVYFRSLTVSRYNLVPHRTLPVEFEVLDPKSVPLPDSRSDGLTDHGVGNGSFRLPDALPAGVYTLVARGLDGNFPEERRAFEVRGPATPQSQAAAKIAVRRGTMQVEFFPEGGHLAAGIENRVYFAARDAKGQPLEIRGEIVDSKGGNVTGVESARGGLGVFNIVPDAAETYRLKISSPAGSSESPLVPPAFSEQKIAIATVRSIFAPGAPLEFNLRAAQDRLPLVITARLRGMLVGQRMLVTSSPVHPGEASVVSMPLDDQAAGMIRLTVYDYTKSPPQVLAQRWVYRQPRRLVVRAAEEKKRKFSVSLSTQNEKGRPVAAALGLTVLRDGKDKTSSPSRCGPDLLHALLTDGDYENAAALADVNLNLADADGETERADDTPTMQARCPAPAALLDLVLGCCRPLATGKQGAAKRAAEENAAPPLLFDNLGELRSQYEATLNEYLAKRTHVVNALIMLGFFGGLALALLVTMLALMRIVWGSRLWLPTVVATVCCVVVTTVSNEPSRMKPVAAAAVGFAPFMQSPNADPREQNRSESALAESKLRSLAERLSKVEGDAEELKSDRFVVRQYAQPVVAPAPAGEDPAKPLAWYPLLITNPDGRVTLPGFSSADGQPIRLIIDAHGDGRIESCQLLVK